MTDLLLRTLLKWLPRAVKEENRWSSADPPDLRKSFCQTRWGWVRSTCPLFTEVKPMNRGYATVKHGASTVCRSSWKGTPSSIGYAQFLVGNRGLVASGQTVVRIAGIVLGRVSCFPLLWNDQPSKTTTKTDVFPCSFEDIRIFQLLSKRCDSSVFLDRFQLSVWHQCNTVYVRHIYVYVKTYNWYNNGAASRLV